MMLWPFFLRKKRETNAPLVISELLGIIELLVSITTALVVLKDNLRLTQCPQALLWVVPTLDEGFRLIV